MTVRPDTPDMECLDMGVNVEIRSESGEVLERWLDPRNTVIRLINASRSSPRRLLDYVDPYGDTVFNVLQAQTLLDEWSAITPPPEDELAKATHARVRELICSLRHDVHRYLWFLGD